MLFSACVLPLIAWTALGLGYYFFFFTYTPSPGWFFAPFFCSMTLVFLWGALRQILFGSEQLIALKRAERREQPIDGKLTASFGTIQPIREALTSPLFGQRCVAYNYEASKTRHNRSGGKSSTHEVKYFTGFALTPSVIKGLNGECRLLGFPILDSFPCDRASSVEEAPETYKHFEEYIKKSPIEKVSGSKISKAFSAFEDLLTDDDGSMKYDWAPEELDIPISELELQEHTVPVGAEVTAFGIYDAAKGGLVPRKSPGPVVVELYPGDTAEARKALKSKGITSVVFALILFAAAHGITYLALQKEIAQSVQEIVNKYPIINEYMEKYWP